MSNGFIYVVDAHFIDKIEEEENILDPSACEYTHLQSGDEISGSAHYAREWIVV